MSGVGDSMGLDSVELLLAVEDAFQIHIEDHEAGGVSTVGDLYNLVVTKLQGQDSKRCLTSAAFYRTRRGSSPSEAVHAAGDHPASRRPP